MKLDAWTVKKKLALLLTKSFVAMMKKSVFILSCLIILFSCQKNEIRTIVFNEPEDCRALAGHISGVTITPLENDGHYFGWGADLVCAEDGYVVVDKENTQVFHYGPDGRFLNNIGVRGNGPGEYRNICNVQTSNSDVFIFSAPETIINHFNLDGTFRAKRTEKISGMQYRQIDEGLLVYHGYGTPAKCKVTLHSDAGDKKFLPYSSNVTAFDDFNPTMTECGNQIFVRDPLERTVYVYQQGDIEPYLTFDFGKYNIEDSFFDLDYMSSGEYLRTHECYMIARYLHNDEMSLIEINRTTDSAVCYGLLLGGKWIWFNVGALDNDPFAGAIKAIDGKDLVCLVDPSLLIKPDANLGGIITDSSVLSSLKSTDNDVIIRIQIQ